MCRCNVMENSGALPVSDKFERTMKKSTSKKITSMVFFWVCLATAVFIFLIGPSLDSYAFRRTYMARFNTLSTPRDICSGKRVYMYELPPSFNVELWRKCDRGLIYWLDLCRRFDNGGYGLKLWNDSEPNEDDEFDRTSWYDTDSYMLEVIFHKRLNEYPCLTQDPSMADAFFVPYYTGLQALVPLYPDGPEGRSGAKNLAMRKSFGKELVTWLQENGGEKWRRFGGRDHFLILGRTTWDFQFEEVWGTGFSALPHVANMTRLLIERDPEHENEYAIPYPTSFHPSSPGRLAEWIAGVKNAERKYLFSYVGAPRPDAITARGVLSSQCLDAGESTCKFVNCSIVRCSHDPESIYKAFLQATFCLEPRGDSTTRRSTFDCLISGAIPVFFHNASAYLQYFWHLPQDPESYSVFISEEDLRSKRVSIKEVLMGYSAKRIAEMRRKIVSLIPSLIYNDYSNDPLSSSQDAFEVSIASVLKTVARRKNAFSSTTQASKKARWKDLS